MKLATSLIGSDTLVRDLKRELETIVKKTAEVTETTARNVTPIKTGNARKNWKKTVRPETFTVENRVPYIERLEAGASRQAPRGIIGPTLTQVKGKIK